MPETKTDKDEKAEVAPKTYGESLFLKGYPAYYWVAKAEDLSDAKQPEIATTGYRDPVRGIIAISMPMKEKLLEAQYFLKKYGNL